MSTQIINKRHVRIIDKKYRTAGKRVKGTILDDTRDLTGLNLKVVFLEKALVLEYFV